MATVYDALEVFQDLVTDAQLAHDREDFAEAASLHRSAEDVAERLRRNGTADATINAARLRGLVASC